MAAPRKAVVFKDGLSEGAWKSLVIKALRVGWVEGLLEASTKMSKSAMKSLLVGSLFEDVFPAGWVELNECLEEIERQDYMALCQRETHHGRGLADRFCDLEKESVEYGRLQFYQIMDMMRANSNLTWLNPRIANCLYTWRKINPHDVGVKRSVLYSPWKGMPVCVLDGHTYEGKMRGKKMLLLSGHYENHRIIGERVMREGWDGIRKEAMNEYVIVEGQQKNLF